MAILPFDTANGVEVACSKLGGIGSTSFYRMAGRGEITLLKLNGRTVVLDSEIDRYLKTLPVADIKLDVRER